MLEPTKANGLQGILVQWWHKFYRNNQLLWFNLRVSIWGKTIPDTAKVEKTWDCVGHMCNRKFNIIIIIMLN